MPIAIAKPNIESVVADFLNDPGAAQDKTAEDKRGVLELFIECTNSYGHQFLNAEELEILDRYGKLDDSERLDFSQVFGPDKIPQNVSLFVGYYVIAEIMLEGDEMAAYAEVVAEFCRWLGEKKLLAEADAIGAAERASKLALVLAQADHVNRLIWEESEKCPTARQDYLSMGYRKITRIEDSAIWLVAENGIEIGPVVLPQEGTQMLAINWTICSALAKSGGNWHFCEVGNVYPDECRDEYVVKR